MRTLAGLIAFHGSVLATGTAVLLAARAVAPRPKELLLALGLAHLAGVAALVLAWIFLLLLGAKVEVVSFLALALILTVALLVVARMRHRADPVAEAELLPPGRLGPRWAVLLIAAALAAFLVAQVASSRDIPTAWDASHNWTLKALVILYDGDLGSGAFRDSQVFPGAHQDYPIFHPVLGGIVFRFTNRPDQSVLIAELWMLLAAFVAAAAYLLRGRGGVSMLVLAPLGIAVAAGPTAGIVRGDADMTMGVFLAAGVLCLALALERARPGALPLGALFLAAAANTKNEGMVFALAAVAVAFAASLVRPGRGVRGIALTGAAAVAAVVPWRVWVAAHGPFPSDVRSLGDSLDPGLLADSLHQLDFAAQTILSRIADGSGSGWLFPAFVVLAVLLLVSGAERRTVAMYLGIVLAMLAALLWIYWTSPQPDVEAHIERTSLRTLTGPILVCAVALAHTLWRTVGGAGVPER